MEEFIKHCPVCNQEDFETCISCVDHTVSKKEFSVSKCKNCGFKFTNPRPKEENLGEYYKSESYISHSNTKKGLVNNLYQMVRNYTLKKKIELIEAFKNKGTLLDIGCGTGEFLAACKKAGWKAQGIEPSADAREMAIKNYGINVHEESEITNLPPEQFDIITMWHVLEHVPQLN
ncbi:MAG: class I SAM-dependent methyltransferase, partial [Bacteroidetes bacterium]|nr:class I SAM-dependent methyltransferase [Bacteroidota bacterium]